MYFQNDMLVQLALNIFQNLDPYDSKEADRFFETFGPGQSIFTMQSGEYFPDKPYERLYDYETLLKLLRDIDRVKYSKMHKGTPFYIMAWLAFDLQKYEKALFYMDNAISEDIRQSKKSGGKWQVQPAASFLMLKSNQISQLTINKIRGQLEDQLNRFNIISGKNPITITDFLTNFVEKFIENSSHRTIISALYIYLMEYQSHFQELTLRSEEGGSIEPLLMHLFTGGLLFESILKVLYPNRGVGKPNKTITDIFNSSDFSSEFGGGFESRSGSLKEILDSVKDNTDKTAFSTTAKLRNTTGHNFIWDDVFDDFNNYSKLYEQEINALLYLIERKYINLSSRYKIVDNQ